MKTQNMTRGAKYFQQRYQKMFGLCPVICSMQSQNLDSPMRLRN